MKILLTVIVISMLFAGVLAAAGADGVLDLSTLGKKNTEAINIPATSLGTSNVPATQLGGKTTTTQTQALDLSTLGRKRAESTVPPVVIKGPSPITVTPMFSIKNSNITTEAGTVITLPQAVGANNTVYTAPIAIFGGA